MNKKITIDQYHKMKKKSDEITSEDRAQNLKREIIPLKDDPPKIKVISKPKSKLKQKPNKSWYQKMPLKIGIGLGIAYFLFTILKRRNRNAERDI